MCVLDHDVKCGAYDSAISGTVTAFSLGWVFLLGFVFGHSMQRLEAGISVPRPGLRQ